TIGRKLHIHPLLSVVMFFLGATVAGGTGLVLALPVLGVMAVVAQVVAEVVMDRRLWSRYRTARNLVLPGQSLGAVDLVNSSYLRRERHESLEYVHMHSRNGRNHAYSQGTMGEKPALHQIEC